MARKYQINLFVKNVAMSVMPRFIKIGGIEIEQPNADGDFEITFKGDDGWEVYRYLTNAQAQQLVDFISHFLNEA